jgi:hypothetical protein
MSSRVIILEGPDGGGKTTLARHLNEKYGYVTMKTSQPKDGEDLFTSYTTSLLQATGSWRPIVFDRHYLGEPVYGPIMRDADLLGTRGRRLLERLIVSRGVHLVLCLPTWEKLLQAWKDKNGDDYLRNEDQLAKINTAYHRQLEKIHMPVANVLGYRWSETDGPAEESRLMHALFEPIWSCPSFMTGWPQANTLIVGEQVNLAAVPWDLPFHHLGGSSEWLLDRLDDAQVHEVDLCWANALDRSGNFNKLELATTAFPSLRRVVALGDVAANLCCKTLPNVECVNLPHPQYWKRFKSRQVDEYTRLLQEAIQPQEVPAQ